MTVYQVLDRAPVDVVVKAALAAGTSRQVELMRAPDAPLLPYAVLYPLHIAWRRGSMAYPDQLIGLVYQVTSVGMREDQAQQMADRVRNVMLGRTAAGAYAYNISNPTGVVIFDREAYGGDGGMDRETGGTDGNPVVSVPERFVIAVSPA
jgi:hypothetical protein